MLQNRIREAVDFVILIYSYKSLKQLKLHCFSFVIIITCKPDVKRLRALIMPAYKVVIKSRRMLEYDPYTSRTLHLSITLRYNWPMNFTFTVM